MLRLLIEKLVNFEFIFNNMICLDYSLFLERLALLDDDLDCCLTENQFAELFTVMGFHTAGNFIKIAFNGLRSKKTNTVSFHNVRILFEAAHHDIKSKAILLTLFRGVTSRRDRRLTLEEYQNIAHIITPDVSDEILSDNFNNLDTSKTGKITYPQVALSLFGIRVRQNENPYKATIEYVSPYTGCCRVM